jgi:hypothetical protein
VHEAAVQAGKEHYTDPTTGFFVFTELYHRRRRRCCASGCRHCPYQHAGVPAERRSGLSPPFVLEEG